MYKTSSIEADELQQQKSTPGNTQLRAENLVSNSHELTKILQ